MQDLCQFVINVSSKLSGEWIIPKGSHKGKYHPRLESNCSSTLPTTPRSSGVGGMGIREQEQLPRIPVLPAHGVCLHRHVSPKHRFHQRGPRKKGICTGDGQSFIFSLSKQHNIYCIVRNSNLEMILKPGWNAWPIDCLAPLKLFGLILLRQLRGTTGLGTRNSINLQQATF